MTLRRHCAAAAVLAYACCQAWAAPDVSALHSWTASVGGPALYGKGARAVSTPIAPTGYLPQSQGEITTVRWRYSFNPSPPRELQAYLCNAQRCVLLAGAEGLTEAFRGDDATKGFVFAFQVPGRGALTPVLLGQANQVTVNFR
ncbi:flagellar protein FlhE [Cupriavidus basilensis]|uniref:Flagellar protein FlhE n=1 Tax=Cupriavidus basilensis TaxID=68895 RepID=A0ABT6AGD0_9BURK|nr:flagellar protein FlhE [Cupriavidus basilensis]MDF3831662.1 flagellar protein FlhE [Cupriavidus basilensis]